MPSLVVLALEEYCFLREDGFPSSPSPIIKIPESPIGLGLKIISAWISICMKKTDKETIK